jgi:hypothetical protein
MAPPAAQRSATPSGSGVEGHTFRGRFPRLLSCALAGREKLSRGKPRRLARTIRMLALRPEFPPIMGSRKAVNAQNDSADGFCRHL